MDQFVGRKPIPFYQSYAAFYRAMKALKGMQPLPRRLETRALEPFLKEEAGRVLAGFTSLGWLDEIGRPGDDLRRLVQSFGEESWKATLGEVIPKTYPFVPPVLEDLTPTQLRDAFVAYTGRDVDVIRTAETFFLCLCAEAGYALPDVFYRRTMRAVADAKRSVAQDEEEEEEEEEEHEGEEASRKPPPVTKGKEGAGTPATRPASFWSDQIANLTAMIDANDMTVDEKSALVVMLAYAQRKQAKG